MPRTLPLILFFGLFVVVGTVMWTGVLWGLLTGGPRDRTKPGQPFLYDRLYYGLMLILLTGWTMGLLSFDNPSVLANKTEPSGFMAGWGIMAIGIGLFYPLRIDMLVNGAEYLSKHGFVLMRPFHAMTAKNFQRQRQSHALRLIPVVFAVAGIAVLAFDLPHMAEVPGQVATGLQNLIGQMTGLFRPA